MKLYRYLLEITPALEGGSQYATVEVALHAFDPDAKLRRVITTATDSNGTPLVSSLGTAYVGEVIVDGSASGLLEIIKQHAFHMAPTDVRSELERRSFVLRLMYQPFADDQR